MQPPRVAMALRHLSYTSLTSDVIYYSAACPSILLIISLFLFFHRSHHISLDFEFNCRWIDHHFNNLYDCLLPHHDYCTFLQSKFHLPFISSMVLLPPCVFLVHYIYRWMYKNGATTWAEISLKLLDPRSSEYLSQVLLWVQSCSRMGLPLHTVRLEMFPKPG